MLRLYLDEDSMSEALARGLAARGVDLTASRAGMRRRTDAEQLAFATRDGRAIYSFNVGDFMRLHTQHMRSDLHHSGIILVGQGRYDVGEQLRRLERLARDREPAEMFDRLEFLNDWG